MEYLHRRDKFLTAPEQATSTSRACGGTSRQALFSLPQEVYLPWLRPRSALLARRGSTGTLLSLPRMCVRLPDLSSVPPHYFPPPASCPALGLGFRSPFHLPRHRISHLPPTFTFKTSPLRPFFFSSSFLFSSLFYIIPKLTFSPPHLTPTPPRTTHTPHTPHSQTAIMVKAGTYGNRIASLRSTPRSLCCHLQYSCNLCD
ncbi:hypothetical protein EDB80DRAFT_102739 [Ilyonectria destructans]|nr:hypothetical protein EDB80DRAFT_102739 [Ilyonectria destructans]